MRRGWWSVGAGLVAACAAIGCHDGTAPELVNTTTILAAANTLTATFSGDPAYRSLGVLSTDFAPALSLVSNASLQLTERPANALFPADELGRTLGWDSAQGKYVVMPQLAGAPAAGVRFLLYTADPQGGIPAFPLQQLGSVDLTDESSPQADKLGVVLRLGSATLAQYDITDVTATSSRHVTLAGWITGVDDLSRVTFTLDHLTDFADTTLQRRYTLSGSGALLDLVLHATPSGADTSQFTAALGRAAVGFASAAANPNGSYAGQVTFDGVAVANLSGAAGMAVGFAPAHGFTITAQQQSDLSDLFAVGSDLGTLVSGLFGPALAVFGAI